MTDTPSDTTVSASASRPRVARGVRDGEGPPSPFSGTLMGLPGVPGGVLRWILVLLAPKLCRACDATDGACELTRWREIL